MLARLSQVPCAEAVEVDHSGRIVRVWPTPHADGERCLEQVIARLAASGIEATLADADTRREAIAVDRWYGPERVGELSREEARRLGARFARSFAAQRSLDPGAERALAASIEHRSADALIAHGIESAAATASLASEALEPAIELIRSDAVAIIGTELAAELATYVRGELRALAAVR